MQLQHILSLISTIVAVFATGCRRDVGTCFDQEALNVVFDENTGIPMYEGQALVVSTCGNGAFCHSADARGSARFGVPKGLDFDVSVACSPERTCSPDDVDRLLEDRKLTTSISGLMVGQVKSKAMPPGNAGEITRAGASRFIRTDATALPSIDSKEGREIVRNWIACDSPVVGQAVQGTETNQGQPCSSAEAIGEIGATDCRYSAPEPTPPDPTWTSIYAEVIEPRCVVCHRFPTASNAGLAVLDFGPDKSSTLVSMRGRAASTETGSGAMCAGQGPLITPGAMNINDSLLLQKLAQTHTCGDEMPVGGIVPISTVEVIRQWIELGAMDD